MPISRKLIARLALGTLPVVALAGGAHAASAQPVKGSGGASGCTVEIVDANGNTVGTKTVPVGTQIGLFTCGSDGEWHFGWLVNARVQAPTTPGVKTPATKATAVNVSKAFRTR